MKPSIAIMMLPLFAAALVASSSQPSVAALAGEAAQSAAAPSTQSSQTVSGIVFNATTNQPLPRALVQVEGRSMLTGQDGRFEFDGVTGGNTIVSVRKPGFYGSADFIPAAVKTVAADTAGNVEMLLYPEAIISGTARGPDGQSLSQVFMQAWRRFDDESGRQWLPAGQTNTNSDGEFRLPLQAGDYIVETQYSPGRPGNHEAILPTLASAGGGGTLTPMHLAAGSESRLDLRPQVRDTHSVTILLDDESGDGSRNEGRAMPMQLQARMLNGIAFRVTSRQGDAPGEIVATLPRGTFTLIAQRILQTGSSYGETRVTVADRDIRGVALHVARVLPLAVEVVADPALTSDNKPPSAQQLGLNFVPVSAVPGPTNLMFFMSQGGEAAGPTLLPGAYRLHAASTMQWFVESANLGGTDLMTQDLVVEAGSSLAPLRLVVSNQTGTIRATVKLGGTPSECDVYLIAMSPTLAPIAITRSGSDGSLDRAFVPPGTYRVLASEAPLNGRLTDPAVQARFAPYMQTVTVAAGESANMELEAISAAELKP